MIGGAGGTGNTREPALNAPSSAMRRPATHATTITTSDGACTPSAWSPINVARPAKAPAITTSPCANWMTSSTPKNNVNPTATIA